MSLQPNEVLIIAFVALIVLGPKRLPGAIRSIGSVFRQVREFSANVRQEIDATLSPPSVDTSSSDGSQAGTTAGPEAESPETPAAKSLDTGALDTGALDTEVLDVGACETDDASHDQSAIDRTTSDGAA